MVGEEYLQRPIFFLGLPNSTQKKLKRRGIQKIADLKGLSRADLCNMGLSMVEVLRIEEAMERLGFYRRTFFSDFGEPYTLTQEETDALLFLTVALDKLKGTVKTEVRMLLRDLYYATNDIRPQLAARLPDMAYRVRQHLFSRGKDTILYA